MFGEEHHVTGSVLLTYSKDDRRENILKQDTHGCLLLPLIKCQTSPHLE